MIFISLKGVEGPNFEEAYGALRRKKWKIKIKSVWNKAQKAILKSSKGYLKSLDIIAFICKNKLLDFFLLHSKT